MSDLRCAPVVRPTNPVPSGVGNEPRRSTRGPARFVPRALAAVILAGATWGCSDGTRGTDDGGTRVCTASGACEEAPNFGPALHTATPIDYADPPPVGGEHNPCWASYQVYDHEIPDENWVHNLEHGAVVVLYACPSGCAGELTSLAAFAANHPRVLVSPYASLGSGFAIVSWGHRLVSSDLDLGAFEAFYAKHFDRAPESVGSGPPGACPAL